MDTRKIRENCYQCGYRSLQLMKGAGMPTDFCDHALMECSQISYCHPSIRIPKKKEARKKKAVQDV